MYFCGPFYFYFVFLVIFNSICTLHLQTYWRNIFRGFMFAPFRFLGTTATWEQLNRILGLELWSRDATPCKGLSAFGLHYSASGSLSGLNSNKERFNRISPDQSWIPASVLSYTLGCQTSLSLSSFKLPFPELANTLGGKEKLGRWTYFRGPLLYWNPIHLFFIIMLAVWDLHTDYFYWFLSCPHWLSQEKLSNSPLLNAESICFKN